MFVRSGTILMYNCSGPEFSKMRQIFAMLRLRMRVISPNQYHLPLGELAQGKGEPGEEAEPLPEAMLVFCGLTRPLLHQVLEVIRLAKLPPIELKAVLTSTNQSWNTMQLREELIREREAMEAKRAEKAAETDKEADKPEDSAAPEGEEETPEEPAQEETAEKSE